MVMKMTLNKCQILLKCMLLMLVFLYFSMHSISKHDKHWNLCCSVCNMRLQLNSCHLQISLERSDLHASINVTFYLFIILSVKFKIFILLLFSCFTDSF
jgi:hypothetical protein